MAKRSSKFYFKREKEIMQKLGLTPTIASGSGWKEKEDGYSDTILAQLKSTHADSYRITMDDLRKLDYHATIVHKVPLFVVDFIEHDKLYLVLEVDNIEGVYNHLIDQELLTSRTLQPLIVNELIAEDQDDIKVKEPRTKITSGNKQKFWENHNKEMESRRKGKWEKKK